MISDELPWPFKPGADHPYLCVEIAPNEYVLVVLAGDYDALQKAHHALMYEHEQLREVAHAQVEAANAAIDIWRHYGRRPDGTV